MFHQEQNIRLRTPTVPNHCNASLVRFWNSLIGQTQAQISRILAGMTRRRLFRFLKFMHYICLHDQSIQYSQERLEHYQTILMCCPMLSLTKYLFSIDKQCIVNLLEKRDDIWSMYLVGLLELQNNSEVDIILDYLMLIYGINFISDLIFRLVREASNRALLTHVRQNIFDFICGNLNIVLFISQKENEKQELEIEQIDQEMNSWMLNFSQEHGLNFDPRFTIELYYEVNVVLVKRTVELYFHEGG